MTAAIVIDRLTKRYRGTSAISDLSLEVPVGSIVGFLGPNGAGKTTTLKILAGLARATSGTASVNGIAVSAQGAHRAQVGYLAQEPRFYGWMSGRETLRYVASFFEAPKAAQIDSWLELVGLTDAADRPTRTYSGGMRQRLGIAQALAGDPSVLLLDEPAAALDPLGRHDVLEIMQRLRGDKTIFYSTHILDDVQRVSDHIAIVDHGRLVTSAATSELVRASTRGTLRVSLLDADGSTAAALAALPGVGDVSQPERRDGEWSYDLTIFDGQIAAVQRAVTRLAGETGLTVTTNRQATLDLEDVFLRIVDKERAA
ncbi:MAG TPA: ABC transporter ATP-binding protein [Candidatus Limnocylindrales bacterium]|jgi:ABC-2 type transport system ATP-binding protein